MRPKYQLIIVCALLLSFYPAKKTVAKTDADSSTLPFLSPDFGEHMVLQRGKPDTLWGWSTPGDSIHVTFENQSASTTAGADGRWEIHITPPPPGGPYTLTIAGAKTVQLHDVLVGDVWLCGGQSNMELGITAVHDAAKEIAAANYPQVRLYIVRDHVAYSSAPTVQGSWKVCTPKTIVENGSGFSAVAYFFGTTLNNKIHVPIGLMKIVGAGPPSKPGPALTPSNPWAVSTRRSLRCIA